MIRKRITKPGLRRWAQTQPTTTVWDFYNNVACPLACYLKSLGHTGVNVGGLTWRSRERDARNEIPESIRHALRNAQEELSVGDTLLITQPKLVKACR